MGSAIWEQVTPATFVNSLTAEDIAFWLGRVARGLHAAGPEAALATVARTVAIVTAINGAIQLPGAGAQAINAAVDRECQKLQAQLRAAGIDIGEADARAILTKLLKDPELSKNMKDLADDLNALMPLVEAVGKSLPYQL